MDWDRCREWLAGRSEAERLAGALQSDEPLPLDLVNGAPLLGGV